MDCLHTFVGVSTLLPLPKPPSRHECRNPDRGALISKAFFHWGFRPTESNKTQTGGRTIHPTAVKQHVSKEEILLGRGFFVENLRQTAFLARGRLFVKDVALDRFVQ
jgi:hypothetical protein